MACHLLAALGVMWWTLACGSTGPDPLVISVEGRVERSETVTLGVAFEGTLLPDSEVTWSATPPGAVTLGPGPRAVFNSVGLVTLLATTAHGVAETFVRRTRFDPFHSAPSEQALHRGLLQWLAARTTSASGWLSAREAAAFWPGCFKRRLR